MNLDNIISKLEALEDAVNSQKKTVANILTRLTASEDSISSMPDNFRGLRKEVDRLNSATNALGGFDAALAQIRKDVSEKFNNAEMKQKNQVIQQEKLFQKEIDLIREELILLERKQVQEITRRLKILGGDDVKIVKQISDIEKQLTSFEDIKQELLPLKNDLQRNNNQYYELRVVISSLNKKHEEFREKLNVFVEDQRRNENRLNELIASDSDRVKKQESLIQQINEHNQKWDIWQRQLGDTFEKSENLLNQLTEKSRNFERSQKQLSDVSNRFDRRINELVEMHRLFEERFDKEWKIFKADVEKRWANYSLIYGDKQEDYVKQMDDLKNRLVDAEDSTQVLQDTLLVMSTEIQKGMQALMKMVNGWLKAFDQMRENQKE